MRSRPLCIALTHPSESPPENSGSVDDHPDTTSQRRLATGALWAAAYVYNELHLGNTNGTFDRIVQESTCDKQYRSLWSWHC